MTDFQLHLTDEQYDELAQFWHEYMVLGPADKTLKHGLTGVALAFSQWIDADEDEPCYGLPEIMAFFAEKERREGTAWPKDEGGR